MEQSNKLNIFILEDDGKRYDQFYTFLIDHNIISTNNSMYGCQLLTNFKFDIILLDHDLGGEAFVDLTRPNTGTRLCSGLKSDNINIDTQIIIHSWNQVGAKNMEKILKDTGFKKVVYVPFSRELFSIINDNNENL